MNVLCETINMNQDTRLKTQDTRENKEKIKRVQKALKKEINLEVVTKPILINIKFIDPL